MLLFRDAILEAMGNGNKQTCIVHMAQAAETLIKARIADQDVREIFWQPKKEYTSLEDFLYNAKSIGYRDLPSKLKNIARIEIGEEYESKLEDLGRIRNQIVHTSIKPYQDLHRRALVYANDLLDPICQQFWGYSVIKFMTNDPWISEYIYQTYTAYFDGTFSSKHHFERLVPLFENTPFLRALLANDALDDWESYKNEVKRRIDVDSVSDDLFHCPEDLEERRQQDELDQALRTQIEREKQEKWDSFLADFQAV